jgi:UDP-2,4-diacetamido-2,4,6-trideoxy-beta-L-altropyranose hydrolase
VNKNRDTLLIRADANVLMGTGHVMRCLALAQAWQGSGREAVFAMVEPSPAVRERLLSEGMEVVPIEVQPGSIDDARCVAELASQCAAAWVVVDGYHFGADYQRELKAAGLQVLFVDDYAHAGHYAADVVLNQNAGALENLYPRREPYTQFLLGSRYVLLRREFEPWRTWKREIPALGRKILITMGGSDPDNLTSRAIEALMHAGIEGLEAVVVAGGSNPHLDSLQPLTAQCGEFVRLLRDPSNMPDLMAWADLALIAAGGTLWELLSMGCCILSYARNPVQAQIISRLHDEGIVHGLGYAQDCSPEQTAAALVDLANSQERRARFSRFARERIDGHGAERVLESLVFPGVAQL